MPIPIQFVTPQQLQDYPQDTQAWMQATGFKADPGSYCLIPGVGGALDRVLVGRAQSLDTWTLGQLPQVLPALRYTLPDDLSPEASTRLVLGWRLGQYRFLKYKQKANGAIAELIPPAKADVAYVETAIEAITLTRDLINTPASDMGPAELEAAAHVLAVTYGADLTVITGPDLETENYPMIYAVGKASASAPRLLDMRWGDLDAPKVTLVGKGVCFDSGGLDLKPSKGMLMMKKDMGGAAHALGLALMIMKLRLPICLRVLIPAVENSVSGNAMRPLDVLHTRKGITVEVGNTDAEGRLVLADALWEATRDHPHLLVDFATLTGAARVALGSELPAFFCNDADTIQALNAIAATTDDPLWNLPLHTPYRDMLGSKVADLSNVSNSAFGGAITAALFLQEFVTPDTPWIHIDVMAWNLRSLPGRPEGGEAMGLRSLFELIRQRFVGGA